MLRRWNVADLKRRLCFALDIARQAVERLAEHGYKDPAEPAHTLRPEKVISETAILLYAASAASHHAEVAAAIETVARLLLPHARGKRMLLGVCLEPSLALDFAESHICLSKLGYPDPGFDELLRVSRNAQAGFARERVPYRVLEQRWIEGIWMAAMSGQRRASPALASVLNQPIDVLGGSREDIYAFTHALIYLRDFNIRPHRLPRARSVILAEAEAALARCFDKDDYDPGAEVLMAWPLTGTSWSVAAAFGFRVIARLEDKNGYLPSSSTQPPRPPPSEGEARHNDWLAGAYHTIYVMGLLCAAALHPGRAPPTAISPSAVPHRDGVAASILQFLDADGKPPFWRQEVDELSPAERDALAGFLLHIALYRKVRQREFGAVHELLRIGYRTGLADTPTSSQCAELLERVAIFEHITGISGADVKKLQPMPV